MSEEQNEQPTEQPPQVDELATLREQLSRTQDELAAARTAEAAGVGALRETLRTANPHLRADAIDGSTVADLQAAFSREQATYEHYKTAVSGNGHTAAPIPPKVPAGGTPPGPAIDTSKMTGSQRIAHALGNRGA